MRTPRDPIYAGHRYPAEVSSYAVWLYSRFPLSLRIVEEMLAARGISVTHETIRQWGLKFGREFANRIRRRAPRRGDKWHLDEVVISFAGKKHWLWRAVDQDGFVLDVLVCSDPHGCPGRGDRGKHQGVGLDDAGAGGRGRQAACDGGRGLDRGAEARLCARRQSAGDHGV